MNYNICLMFLVDCFSYILVDKISKVFISTKMKLLKNYVTKECAILCREKLS